MATQIKRETDKEIKIENYITGRPVRRTIFDIADWRKALEHAESDNGNRVNLYDLYNDILLDPHLSSQWQKRISNITNTRWKFFAGEKYVEELEGLLQSPQFEEVLTELMNTLAWGKTVLELGKKTISRFSKKKQVLSVYNVKRQHIRPKEGVIVKEQNNSAANITEAIKYKEGNYANYVADLGSNTDLGLILKAVPYVLLKRGDVGDWAQFVQLFGMPFREYRYSGYDDASYEILKKNADEMGSAPYVILPDGTSVVLHETKGSGQGGGDVFEKLARFCDEQISILILGNTETTNSSKSSGYAQSETHMKTQIEVYRDDTKYTTTWLNETIRPILYNLGYPVADGVIKADKESNLVEVKDKLAIIQQVKTLGEPVDADFIYETSGVPKPDNYDTMKAEQEAQKQAEQAAKTGVQKPKAKKADAPNNKLMDEEEQEGLIYKLRTALADFFAPSPVMPGNVTEHLQQLYFGHTCHTGCSHATLQLADDTIDDLLNDFAQSLHSGQLGSKGIHARLYLDTARKLTEAITTGMGKASFSFDDPNNALRANLLSNVHAFSGAKSLTENTVFSQLLLDDKGELKPFKQYLNDVKKLNVLYNENYLSAEYNNAVASSQTAILWNQYNDDDWLEYSTAGDERVRDSHKKLDGIVMQKRSPFWNTHWPPNAWNCRCTVVPADAPKQPLTDSEAGKIAKGSIEGKPFEFNSGQAEVVFTNDHPYFKSHKGTNQLDAVKNYGLKKVEQILKQEGLPATSHIDTETDYYLWWKDMVKKYPASEGNTTDFVLQDKNGVSILFDATPDKRKATTYFKDHIIAKKVEARHEYAANIEAIITQADEVWYNATEWKYLKYFNDGLYVVIVEKDNVVRAVTMYKVDAENYFKLRKGVLIK